MLAARDWQDVRGRRIGVVTNPTGVLRSLDHVVDAMRESGAVDVVAVFGPEHGFRGTSQAGVRRATTATRGPASVYDAYGADADKLAGMFAKAGVEQVVFDIADVGARFYTYIWTMYTAMRRPSGRVPGSWCWTGRTRSGTGWPALAWTRGSAPAWGCCRSCCSTG